jgi:Domain of unknown function (DUF4158)
MKWRWKEDELHAYWLLTPEEQALLDNKTLHGRLGFVVLLKYFQIEGRFPESQRDIPDEIVEYLANQISVHQEYFDKYSFDGSTNLRDRSEILTFLGIRRVTVVLRMEGTSLKAWFLEHVDQLLAEKSRKSLPFNANNTKEVRG